MNDDLTPREQAIVTALLKELAQANLVTTAIVRALCAQPTIDAELLGKSLKVEEQRLGDENIAAKDALRQLIANGEGYG